MNIIEWVNAESVTWQWLCFPDKPMDCSDQMTQNDNQIIQQLCEVTGVPFEQAFNAFIVSKHSWLAKFRYHQI